MSGDPKMVDGTVYLQVEGERNYGGKVWRLKIVNATMKAPTRPRSGVQLVAVTLRMPASVFEPWRPVAVVDVAPGSSVPVLVVVTTPEVEVGALVVVRPDDDPFLGSVIDTNDVAIRVLAEGETDPEQAVWWDRPLVALVP